MTNITFSEPQNTPHCHALFEGPGTTPRTAVVGRLHGSPGLDRLYPGSPPNYRARGGRGGPPTRALLFTWPLAANGTHSAHPSRAFRWRAARWLRPNSRKLCLETEGRPIKWPAHCSSASRFSGKYSASIVIAGHAGLGPGDVVHDVLAMRWAWVDQSTGRPIGGPRRAFGVDARQGSPVGAPHQEPMESASDGARDQGRRLD